MMTSLRHVLLLLLLAALTAAHSFAQTAPAGEKPADNMQILREKLMSDKKLVVATSMELTESEAKNFWPVYEDYQKELNKINEQLAMTIVSYANEYTANTLTDASARKLLDQSLAVEEAEVKLKRAFLPRLSKVLPGRKVARYMQIENKIRVLVKYEIVAEVPLAP